MTAHKSECPAATGQNANQSTNTASIAPAQILSNTKDLANLQAQFALAGHTVIRGGHNDFIVTRWGMTRYCESFDALQRFARIVGVQQ